MEGWRTKGPAVLPLPETRGLPPTPPPPLLLSPTRLRPRPLKDEEPSLSPPMSASDDSSPPEDALAALLLPAPLMPAPLRLSLPVLALLASDSRDSETCCCRMPVRRRLDCGCAPRPALASIEALPTLPSPSSEKCAFASLSSSSPSRSLETDPSTAIAAGPLEPPLYRERSSRPRLAPLTTAGCKLVLL